MSKITSITCALTGVLTDPKDTGVPVTPEEMANHAYEAYNAGATIVHCHFRQQEAGKTHLATWDTKIVKDICDAIRAKIPKIIINMSTGTVGPDIEGPLACLKVVKPEMAALNAGSLNYLKIKSDGKWAWKPFLFDNPIEKIEAFAKAMYENGIVPECECFDTGIVRTIPMLQSVGILKKPTSVSFVMGVGSGMPANPDWLPLLVEELELGTHWQTIVIGRDEVWPLLEVSCRLGGDVRTGLEDTFYLPDGTKTKSNGKLVEALAKIVKKSGKEVASVEETRKKFGLRGA